MKPITEKELHRQQHLSLERLINYITPKYTGIVNRSKDSLIELIHWAKESYSCELSKYKQESVNIGAYIHNKIVIDGNFLQFCEEENVLVTCLVKDAIASWNTEHDYEHFIAQGIFKISYNDFDFLHCALFHKGNQNEDEVSFFVLVHNEDYEKYIELRNKYEKWQLDRDSNSQEIWVVGGNPISYESDLSWEDVFLDDSVKEEIKTSVEGFLNSKDFYKDNGIPWKRGILFFGPAGTGKSLSIKTIIAQYGFKPVTIQPGHPQADELLEEAFIYAEDHGPSLLFLEDLPELLTNINSSHFLQLLDGVQTKEGLLVIGTANDLSKIPSNITDRPSRFDRKILFDNPSKDLSIKYLKKWFKDSLNDDEYKKIVSKTFKNNFSFAYLKELFVMSAHISIARNSKSINYKDVDKALSLLSKDKGFVQTGFGIPRARSIDISAQFEEEFGE